MLVALLGLAGAAQAGVLRVDSAIVVFASPEPSSPPGSVQLKGRLTNFGIDPSKHLRLDLGGSTRWVNLRREPGEILAARSGEHGYLLSIDQRLQRIEVRDPDTIPKGQNPLLVELRQGSQVACAMLRFREEPQRWIFDGTHLPCHLREPPEAEPAKIPAGVATEVRFRVAVSGGARIDRGILRLVRADDLLARVGDPLCTMTAAGGVFTCAATLTEPNPGWLRLLAEGEVDRARLVSPSTWLEVTGEAAGQPAGEAPAPQ